MVAIIPRKYGGASHIICNFKNSAPKKNPTFFNTGSNYDYRFIIKELVKEFKNNLLAQDKKTEKYITFTVPFI